MDPNAQLKPIPEEQTPEPESLNDSTPPVAPIADITDQVSFGETLSEPSEESESQPESNVVEESQSPIVEEETSAENPPFLIPTNTAPLVQTSDIPEPLKKAINFRKTLKHKKRVQYEGLSDSEKAVTKKKIIDHLIHVLRASTHRSTYTSHKKSIVKLRHTLNKHLDYIETKKHGKTSKKTSDPSKKNSRRSKSKQ
jgi:hypothetical protein